MINARIRSQLRFQSGLFMLLFLATLGLLAWLSQLHPLAIEYSI